MSFAFTNFNQGRPVILDDLVTDLALRRLGQSGVTQGFKALPQVTGYTATDGRFRRTATGFVRCAANEERLCFNAAGQFIGQYLQGADTYNSAPWDDPAAPHTSGSPAFLSTSTGGTIAYAGAHSEADIFGTTGKGVLLTQTATANGFHNANNLALTGVAVGDIMRFHCILSITNATVPGVILFGTASNGTQLHTFNHDPSGNITGQVEALGIRRAGFYDMGTINGKRWWYLWVDANASTTSNAIPRISWGTATADTGRRFHVCELMAQRNPVTPPAAVPVCATAKTFAADTLTSAFANCGYVMHARAMARSQISGGNIVPPTGVIVGVPYDPLETRIEIVRGVEDADRSGIMPNPNLALYATPWRNPTNFAINYGPCRIQRDWLVVNASGKNCVNATVGSVFRKRREKRAILGRLGTSRTFLTGSLTLDENIFLAHADSRVTSYWEQVSNRSSGGATFDFQAPGGFSAKRCLVIGHTLDTTRARYQIQKDRSFTGKQVYVGEWAPQISGGIMDSSGTRFQYMSRIVPTGISRTTTYTFTHNDIMALDIWSDPLLIGSGTYSFEMRRCFFGNTTSYGDMYLAQSQREIRISTDGGATFQPFSATGLTIKDLPHGVTATYVGTYDPGTDTVAYGTAPNKGPLRFRYYESGSVTGFVNKPGYQIHMSQMDMGDHTRYPNDKDVFRTGVEVGPTGISMIVEHCYQSGQWTNASTWSNFTGAQIGNPTQGSTGTHPDFLQINRFDAVIQSATFENNVFIGKAQGLFLTGDPSFTSNVSALNNFYATGLIFVGEAIRAVSWSWSLTVGAAMTLTNSLLVQGEQAKPFRFSDGSAGAIQIFSEGTRNTLTLDPSVYVATSGLTAGGTQGGGTIVGAATRLPLSSVSNYTTYTPAENTLALDLVPPVWRKNGDRIRQPETSADARAFRFADNIQTQTGIAANTIIETAQAGPVGHPHADWDAIVADLRDKYLGAPDKLAVTANTAAVGTVLATGITGTGFKAGYGGNEIDGLYEIVGGQLRTAKALTGLNRIDVLLTDADELLVVDITT